MRSGIGEVMVGKDFEVGGKERVCEYVVMVVKSRREKESGNGKKTWLIQEEMRIQSQFLTRIKGTLVSTAGRLSTRKFGPGVSFSFSRHTCEHLLVHTHCMDTEYGTLAE